MNIQTNYNLNFGAKLIKNQTYNEVLQYAIKHNKMPKLMTALENIDKIRKDTFIKMDICYTGDYPSVIFSRYEKGWNKLLQEPTDEYVLKRQVDYISNKKENPVKYAFGRIIKMGNNAPNNKIFQEVIIKKDIGKKKYCLF